MSKCDVKVKDIKEMNLEELVDKINMWYSEYQCYDIVLNMLLNEVINNRFDELNNFINNLRKILYMSFDILGRDDKISVEINDKLDKYVVVQQLINNRK